MKPRVVVSCVLLGLFGLVAYAAPPEIDPAKEADIRRLIDLTGGEKAVADMAAMMIEQFKQSVAKTVPPGERGRQILDTYWRKFTAEFNPAELVENVIPIYDKHLTHEEIKGLIQFYESSLGRRLIEVMPQIMQECYAAGFQWGQEKARKVMREMEKEFPELRAKPPRGD